MECSKAYRFARPTFTGVILAIAMGWMTLDPGGLGASLYGWIEADRGVGALLLFGLAYLAGTLLFVPAAVLAITAGLLFGPVVGIILALLCRTLGAQVAFLIGRYSGSELVQRALKRFQRFDGLSLRLQGRPFSVIFTLRLIPILPFGLLNYALGTTRVSGTIHGFATFLGVLPATVIYVWIGVLLLPT